MVTELALVTGATSGIGYELARQLAERGHDLVIASRNSQRMDEVAAELHHKYKRQVTAISSDLSQPGSAQKLYDDCQARQLNVTMLINNSGFGHIGLHETAELKTVTAMAHLNMTSLVELCTLFGQPMVARKHGYIMNVASVAGFLPIPHMAQYAATKAFVLHFSEALAEEMDPHKVVVSCLCPGPTESNFFQAATAGVQKEPAIPGRQMMTSEAVARLGIDGMFAGRRVVVTGAMNWLSAHAARLTPRRVLTGAIDYMFRKAADDAAK